MFFLLTVSALFLPWWWLTSLWVTGLPGIQCCCQKSSIPSCILLLLLLCPIVEHFKSNIYQLRRVHSNVPSNFSSFLLISGVLCPTNVISSILLFLEPLGSASVSVYKLDKFFLKNMDGSSLDFWCISWILFKLLCLDTPFQRPAKVHFLQCCRCGCISPLLGS